MSYDLDPPPEFETDQLVSAFASITSQLASALDDPAKKRMLLANRHSLLASCETALTIEMALDTPAQRSDADGKAA